MSERGVVIKTEPGRALVMNQRCEFVHISIGSKNVQPGDEVDCSLNDVIVRRRHLKGIAGLVASLLLFSMITWAGLNYYYSNRAYAYVGLEVNPGIELAVNDKGQVLELLSFDADIEPLLEHEKLINMDLNKALETILVIYLEREIISSARPNYIAVSVYHTRAEENDALEGQIRSQVMTFLNRNHVEARIYYFSVNQSTREQARRHGVSSAKYMLWSELGRRGEMLPEPDDITLADPRVDELVGPVNPGNGAEQTVNGNRATGVGSTVTTTDNNPHHPSNEQERGRRSNEPNNNNNIESEQTAGFEDVKQPYKASRERENVTPGPGYPPNDVEPTDDPDRPDTGGNGHYAPMEPGPNADKPNAKSGADSGKSGGGGTKQTGGGGRR